MTVDHIRQTIQDRAATLGLSAYAIAKQAELDPQTVKRYLTGSQSLSSERIAAVCDVLGLRLKAAKK